jgi:hypothetical protein
MRLTLADPGYGTLLQRSLPNSLSILSAAR